MNRRSTLLRSAMILPAILILCASVSAKAQRYVQGALIVRLVPDSSVAGVAQDYNLAVNDGVEDRNVYELYVLEPGAFNIIEFLLNMDRRVMYCEPEACIFNTEVEATPFHIAFDISADAAAFLEQIAYDLIDLGSLGSSSGGCKKKQSQPVTVAVLDTGSDLTHPSLAGRLVPGLNTLAPALPPLDLPNGVTNAAAGHGTMVAGIIVRTAPDALVMPIRVLNADGYGTLIHVIKGIHHAVRHNATVINMSFESPVNSIAFADALNDAYNSGVVLVASAGNDGSAAPHFPAAYNAVIGVGSVDSGDTISSFSNYGVNITVVAPGSSIRSTYWTGGYASWSGTSFAAPFVSAEAAELQAMNPNWSPAQVTSRIVSTADSIDSLNPGYGGLLGAGIIDVQNALGQ